MKPNSCPLLFSANLKRPSIIACPPGACRPLNVIPILRPLRRGSYFASPGILFFGTTSARRIDSLERYCQLLSTAF
jgi:hypothetical protein